MQFCFCGGDIGGRELTGWCWCFGVDATDVGLGDRTTRAGDDGVGCPSLAEVVGVGRGTYSLRT
jgi:hypothetical protein